MNKMNESKWEKVSVEIKTNWESYRNGNEKLVKKNTVGWLYKLPDTLKSFNAHKYFYGNGLNNKVYGCCKLKSIRDVIYNDEEIYIWSRQGDFIFFCLPINDEKWTHFAVKLSDCWER